MRKDGNLIIEYSELGIRTFYGLKKNGRGMFENEETIKIINITKIKEGDDEIKGRYESRNILVSIKDDLVRNKQYILSISSAAKTLVELHDIDENIQNTWISTSFFKFTNESRYIFSRQFQLIEKKDENIYYAAYVQYRDHKKDNTGNPKAFSDSYTLSRFLFTDMNNYEMLTKEFLDNYNNRIVSAFILDKYNVLVVFFLKDKNNKNKYKIRIHDLTTLNQTEEKTIEDIETDNMKSGEGIFFKSLYLKEEYAAFLYFIDKDDGKSIKLKILKINNDYSFTEILGKINKFPYDLDTSITLNEFYKIDEEHLLFVSNTNNNKRLILTFFDTVNSYNCLNTRLYRFDLEGYSLNKELSVNYYNDFLVFTSTILPDGGDFFSFLMFFSYPNGTDFYMDISSYVMDTEFYQESYNLISYLLSNRSIDNNIFGYQPVEEIKLVSIPEEIIFYKSDNDIPLSNGERISTDHVLKQNKDKIKYDKNYFLEYQFIAKGFETYNELYNHAHKKNNTYNTGKTCNFQESYSQKIYYGRTNRLSFRLCHEYCETCEELGNSIDNQKCLTCLPQYKYDYYNHLNIFPSNCVPERYFNDLTNNKLVECSPSNSKFYFNETDNNKKICFDKEKDCPESYPFLNISNNQCIKYTTSTTINNSSPKTEIESQSAKSSNIIEYSSSTSSIKTTLTIYYSTITSPLVNPTTTSIPEVYNYNISQDKCLNGININYLSQNTTDGKLNYRLIEEIINSFKKTKANILYKGIDSYYIHINDINNETNNFNYSTGLSHIDLSTCGNTLKETNNISLNSDLIIIIKEKIESIIREKDIQFCIYNPYNYQKLNISICENTNYYIYIPLKLPEQLEKICKNLIEQGYNPFDFNDKFYREICTPYNSENGTDVLLDEREEFIYAPILNEMICPENCSYSTYDLNNKYIRCECGKNNNITTLNLKNLKKENIKHSFLSTFKSTNYKVMICYNLVFNLKIFVHNYGSIITFIFFIIYLVFIIYYLIRKIYPLKMTISKILEEKNLNNDKDRKGSNDELIINKKVITKKKEKSDEKLILPPQFPPKKKIPKIVPSYNTDMKTTEKIKLENFEKKRRTSDKRKTSNSSRRKNKSKNKNDDSVKSNFKLQSEKEKEEENKNENDNQDKKNLDNYELNNLEYEEACELDKRGFLKTYLSVLMREHLILFTFFNCYDYNLFYVKIERFLTLICFEMTFNGLFFIHETIYGKYVSEEEFTFVQKLPQLIFTLLASHIIEVILCFFCMTDDHIYEIKEISKEEKPKKGAKKIIDKINRKIIWFYVITFIFFLFNWYFISAFCAVYQNTQIIFLRDTGLSILTSFLDPFFIYGVTTLFRFISLLKCCKKKLSCLYKLSDLLPIF